MIRTLIVTLSLIFISSSAWATSPEGYWLAENKRSVIHVKECDEGLCGYIHWIIEGGMQYDSKNPEPSKRQTPMCGLKVIYGFTQDEVDPNLWETGRVYKADDGDLYSAEVEVLSENQLEVTGYIGFTWLGKTQTWNRVSPKDYKACVAPQ